jgi:hypothetical protein
MAATRAHYAEYRPNAMAFPHLPAERRYEGDFGAIVDDGLMEVTMALRLHERPLVHHVTKRSGDVGVVGAAARGSGMWVSTKGPDESPRKMQRRSASAEHSVSLPC